MLQILRMRSQARLLTCHKMRWAAKARLRAINSLAGCMQLTLNAVLESRENLLKNAQPHALRLGA